MLNTRSPIPLYRQLADLLVAKIDRGEFATGSRIPSEPSLAATYGIGRPTVRQAIGTLVQKGVLTRRRGSGTFVNQPQREIDLFSLDGTSASFRKLGLAITTRNLTPLHLTQIQEPGDNPFDQRKAYFLSRLSLADQVPVLMEEIYLDAELFPGLEQFNPDNQSLSDIAERHYHLRPVAGKQNFHIGLAHGERAHLLDIDQGTPILVVHRYLHFDLAKNGVYARLWCRTDRFVFSQNIGGSFHG